MKCLDIDQTYDLTFDKFKSIFNDAKITSIFNKLDIDKSGTIQFNELKSVLTELGHNLTNYEIRKLISEVDTNNDDKISLNEFKIFFKNVPAISLHQLTKLWIDMANVDSGTDLSPPKIEPGVPWF